MIQLCISLQCLKIGLISLVVFLCISPIHMSSCITMKAIIRLCSPICSLPSPKTCPKFSQRCNTMDKWGRFIHRMTSPHIFICILVRLIIRMSRHPMCNISNLTSSIWLMDNLVIHKMRRSFHRVDNLPSLLIHNRSIFYTTPFLNQAIHIHSLHTQ